MLRMSPPKKVVSRRCGVTTDMQKDRPDLTDPETESPYVKKIGPYSYHSNFGFTTERRAPNVV